MTCVVPSKRYYFYHKGYPLSQEKQAEDLAQVVMQYYDRKVPKELQAVCDKKPEKIFQTFLESTGRTFNVDYYVMLMDSLRDIIRKMKNYYDRPRPAELAKQMGINFLGDDLSTAKSPSYPSGHTIQAYVMAKMLIDQFPEHEADLLSIAEMISQSRIDRGVHFPTDIEYGREVAQSLYEQIKEGLGGETPGYKVVFDREN